MNEILQRLETIERYALLGAKQVLTISEAALFTGLTKQTLYRYTCAKAIPHYKGGKGGNQLYFDRAELEAWMKQNKVETRQEAEQAAAAYVAGKRMQ